MDSCWTCDNPFHSYKNFPKEIASRKERIPETYDYRSQFDAYEYDTYHAMYNIEMEDDMMHRAKRQIKYEASFTAHDASFVALETHVDRLLDQLNKDETYEPQGITVLDFDDKDEEQNEEFSIHSTNTMEYSTFGSYKDKEDVHDHNNSLEDLISPIKEHDKESVPFKVGEEVIKATTTPYLPTLEEPILSPIDDIRSKEDEEFLALSLYEDKYSNLLEEAEVTHIHLNSPQLLRVVINQVRVDDSVFDNEKEQDDVSLVKDEHHVVERCYENLICKLTHIILKQVHRKARVGVQNLSQFVCHGKKDFGEVLNYDNTIPSITILISSDSARESVGSLTSFIILYDAETEIAITPTVAPKTTSKIEAPIANRPATILDPALQPDTESELSEAPSSRDYVPASPNYVLASPYYFPGSDPKSNLEESSEDPLEDDPSGDDVSETARLEVQVAPTPCIPLHITPALPISPHRPAIFSTWTEDSFGQPYRTHPNGGAYTIEYKEEGTRSRYVSSSSSSPPPRKRHIVLVYSSSSDLLSPSPSIGPSRKRCISPTTSLPATTHSPTALSLVQADRLPPCKRFRGLPVALLYEEIVEAAAEPIIPPVHPEPNDMERLDEHKEELQTLRDKVAESEGENTSLRDMIRSMKLSDLSLRDLLRMDRARQTRMHHQLKDTAGELRQCQIARMSTDAIEELIAQRVEEALAAREANQNNENRNGNENENSNGNENLMEQTGTQEESSND
nr:hypothetical protein [Tanacetum cinerariifolium]